MRRVGVSEDEESCRGQRKGRGGISINENAACSLYTITEKGMESEEDPWP